MTENEALRELNLQSQVLKSRIQCNREIEEFVSTAVLEYRKDAIDMAIQALEEIQQYRAIGTIEECRKHKEGCVIVNVTFSKDQMKEIVDEKIKEFEVDIQVTRNKTIDEFAEKVSLEISESIIYGMLVDSDKDNSFSDTSDKIVDYVIDTFKKVAEKMKGAAE